ncbi:MAG: DNA-directed RNA polymerase subunit L [Candidatus Bathyarchaeota archaeon]|jgi:DNA-directed RNA polymerase subunit L
MKVKILQRSENELKLEVEGMGHSLCNLLQSKLLEEKSVDLAGYDIPHPIASNPIIFLRTKKGVKPEKILQKAVKEAVKKNKEFRKELEKTFKK